MFFLQWVSQLDLWIYITLLDVFGIFIMFFGRLLDHSPKIFFVPKSIRVANGIYHHDTCTNITRLTWEGCLSQIFILSVDILFVQYFKLWVSQVEYAGFRSLFTCFYYNASNYVLRHEVSLHQIYQIILKMLCCYIYHLNIAEFSSLCITCSEYREVNIAKISLN